MAKRNQANFNVDPDLWERFKAKCIESGSTATGELVAFITRFVDGDETTSATTASIDPTAIERVVKSYLDKNLEQILDHYLKRATLIGEVEIIADGDGDEVTKEKAIDESGVRSQESEDLPLIFYLEKLSLDNPEPTAPIVAVETYAICQCKDRAIISFWTGGGWSNDFDAAKVYTKEGIAKTQVVRLQKGNPGMDIRYNSTKRLQDLLDRTRAA